MINLFKFINNYCLKVISLIDRLYNFFYIHNAPTLKLTFIYKRWHYYKIEKKWDPKLYGGTTVHSYMIIWILANKLTYLLLLDKF